MNGTQIFGLSVGLLFVLLIVAGFYSQHQRHKETRQWATKNGWGYKKKNHHFNDGWTSTTVRQGSVDDFVRRSFPEGRVFSFANSYSSGAPNPTTINRAITGIDLGRRVPTTLILDVDEADTGFRQHTRLNTGDDVFELRRTVLVESASDASAVRELLTPQFLERILKDDQVVRSSDLTLQDHYLILTSNRERELAGIEPAVELLRELAPKLNLG